MLKWKNGIKKHTAFFLLGGVGYGIIELLWRGRTHWTMTIAGGLCFIIFSLIAEKFKEKPLIYKAMLSAIGVTAVELIFGVVFNLIFKMGIWDYSTQPLNFLGQICPMFTLAWCALSVVFLPIADFLNSVYLARTENQQKS